MKRITKKVKEAIKDYTDNNTPLIEWNRSDADSRTIKEILEKGLDKYLEELYEFNLSYIFDLESQALKEIRGKFDDYDGDRVEEIACEYLFVDINAKDFINQLPPITCILYVYSNYDCCNSFDTYEDSDYLVDAYQRTKVGVKKTDFMYEFHNGAYGGSLFCFTFKTDIKRYLEIKDEIENGKSITIPEGMQFGFFSSFQGAGSIFEKATYRKMTIPIQGETEYDSIGITADLEQHYSMIDVYGSNNFIYSGSIKVN